jgi:hypothetical protein
MGGSETDSEEAGNNIVDLKLLLELLDALGDSWHTVAGVAAICEKNDRDIIEGGCFLDKLLNVSENRYEVCAATGLLGPNFALIVIEVRRLECFGLLVIENSHKELKLIFLEDLLTDHFCSLLESFEGPTSHRATLVQTEDDRATLLLAFDQLLTRHDSGQGLVLRSRKTRGELSVGVAFLQREVMKLKDCATFGSLILLWCFH